MTPGFHTILVTGAAGFIGSAVAARLAALGHRVTGCNNFNDYYDPKLKSARVKALLEPCDVQCPALELADAVQVKALFERVRPTLVVHLAAQAGVRYSLVKPDAYLQSNVVAFGHILEACRLHKIEHLLYASSSVYGGNAKVPFSEDNRTDAPLSLYGATKKANELMACSYSHLYRLPATGLRFFTVYGPWGGRRWPVSALPRSCSEVKRFPYSPEGSCGATLPTSTTSSKAWCICCSSRLLGEVAMPHWVFNIGNNQPVTVIDFIRTLERVLGMTARLDFQPMQPGDVEATHADTSKLQAWVGYTPGTALATGLTHFPEWYDR